MTTQEILAELKAIAQESTRKVLANHGAPPHNLGVKVEDMKKIQKKVKKDYRLSLELYDSGVPDAQYLAGLIADEEKMTRKDLEHWVNTASWHMMSEYTVPWIAAESSFGWELALKWIDSDMESIQASGWTTLASLVSIKPDEELDIAALAQLLKRVEKEVHAAGNRVRYAMNSFLIAAGGYVKELSGDALRVGKTLGKIEVNMAGTSCKVPYAPDFIRKIIEKGSKKKKMARC